MERWWWMYTILDMVMARSPDTHTATRDLMRFARAPFPS